MAALYLHNAIFTPESSESTESPHGAGPIPHTRTISSGTLRTITSDSHPSEPLLHGYSTTSGFLTYQELVSPQPGLPGRSRSEWDAALSFEGGVEVFRDRSSSQISEMQVKKRLRLLKRLKVVLELVMAIWALYNSVRYFVAYTLHEAREAETLSLILATSSTLCLAFLICANVFAFFQPRLLSLNVSLRTILISKSAFRSAAAAALLGPAVVNLIFTFLWRDVADSRLNIAFKCHLDVDVIWLLPKPTCRSPSWGFWLALAIIRIVLTFFLVVVHFITSHGYHTTRRPSQSHRRRRRRKARQRTYLDSLSPSITSPPMTPASAVPFAVSHDPQSSTHSSSRTALDRRSFPSSGPSSYLPSNRQSRASSDPPSSDEEVGVGPSPSVTPTVHSIDFAASQQSSTPESDRELNTFVDRFRALVTQISRETDDALQYARPDSVHSLAGSIPAGEQYRYPTSAYPTEPTLGYDENGRPYRPDDQVQIMNGIVRRMPTIESLGSRELASVASSSMYNGVHEHYTHSRPPTRLTFTMTDYTGSEPPSRSNSLSYAAGIMYPGNSGNMTDTGELTSSPVESIRDRSGSVNTMGESAVETTRSGSVKSSNASHVTGTTGSGASRSVFSYHTAGSVSPAQSPSSQAEFMTPVSELAPLPQQQEL